MRKFLTIAVALAAAAAFAGSTTAGVSPAVKVGHVSLVQKAAWDDCHDWDMHKHECRDKGWDHHHDKGWMGERSCRDRGHDHYLGEDGHWHECKHQGGY
ncbi:MAG TPA: hypothetical protein VGL66_08630 [Caulobacteraceae bacterium]|jgi:hypothetical protein